VQPLFAGAYKQDGATQEDPFSEQEKREEPPMEEEEDIHDEL